MVKRPSPDALELRKTARQMHATHTVEAIVEAAARIFEVKGFEGYTTNAIAQKAGVSIGSLYQYFPNKDAITLALIAREANLLEAEIMQASIIERWEEALDAMVLAGVRHQLRRPVLARVLDVEEARCLVPCFDGVLFSREWKEALWDRYVMGAPRPRTPCE
ncbi:TetR/AcrR family transcriptional regulator, partial [Gluconobacter cerinus]|uniref:TetR/AcrR family transcriptional regulator n=1 Tax=Gluconobacter cerinus TaxID=38307 RepID=UPI002011F845